LKSTYRDIVPQYAKGDNIAVLPLTTQSVRHYSCP
jgi:hypothetical protein